MEELVDCEVLVGEVILHLLFIFYRFGGRYLFASVGILMLLIAFIWFIVLLRVRVWNNGKKMGIEEKLEETEMDPISLIMDEELKQDEIF